MIVLAAISEAYQKELPLVINCTLDLILFSYAHNLKLHIKYLDDELLDTVSPLSRCLKISLNFL